MDSMDAATQAKYQKYLYAQLFTESALENAYDNGYFNGEKKGEKKEQKKRILKLASLGVPYDTIAAFGMSEEEVRAILVQKG